ncbi:hypothetical protein L1785_09210 [Antribacter sp. KLBMP9083]|uniref:Uncharacterized protein n=1 Tax=Antribacter soli TaxID=2910976 RepID=A0AA41QE72_9MICO|nr:hypothetical protein [Antribacter soli]MCF4121160.1 hypothetical protein [Antribacter soli]
MRNVLADLELTQGPAVIDVRELKVADLMPDEGVERDQRDRQGDRWVFGVECFADRSGIEGQTGQGPPGPLARPPRPALAALAQHAPVPHHPVHRRTARLPSESFPWHKTNLDLRALREDRILAEAHASGGAVRRLCDLFGISIDTALRYATTIERPPAPERPRPRSRP